MTKNYGELKALFEKIKELGYVKAHRKGDTGIGKTFEDLLGKEEDNLAAPDFKDIEIKSQREATSSMITLFTKSPDYPAKANTYLRENFGNISPEYNGMKILHTTINAVKYNSHISGNDFKICIDYDLKRLVLTIRDHATKDIVYNNAYWTFDNIEKKLKTKLKYIAYVKADEKIENGQTFFKYTDINLITGLTLNNFLEALENGDVMVDIRIGVYNSGKSKGKTHDHGTGFRITLYNLMKYATII